MSSYGFWLSAAGMKINDLRQTLHANNLANAQTTGFKEDLAVVMARPVESRESVDGFGFSHPVLDGMSGGAEVMPTFHNFAQGNIERTNRALDVAIEGDGFFAVSDGTATRYTRDGEFTMNLNGELVLSTGGGRWRVLDADGATIQLDPAGGTVRISDDGTIRQRNEVVGQLGLHDTGNRQSMRKFGENLFDAGVAEMQPVPAHLRSESRESSNYDPLKGLAMMIEASRAYQLNATLVQLQDQVTGQAVSTVGRVA
ncbi:MAG: flagellar hook-basal body protein [Phycisphaerae bacterium]|nr:flagellar hook-basal body protein [Phycisphaerae bacterium]